MSELLAPWSPVERMAAEVLADLSTQPIGTATPENLAEVLPVWRVLRIGGADDGVTDTARLVVETYAATVPEAEDLAEQGRQRLLRRRVRTSHGLIDRGETEVAPHLVPHPNPGVRMVEAIYRLSSRRWA